MSVTEVTSSSWFSRLGDSAKGVVVGLALFLLSFALLFWNEGRAVQRAKALEEGASKVVTVAADRVDPANEGKLIHLSGSAKTAAPAADPAFSVNAPALLLDRRVEMYQWEENSESKTEKKLGGGTEKTTTYTYSRTWSPSPIRSSEFKEPAGHENPAAIPFANQQFTAKSTQVGAFRLTDGQLANLNAFQKWTLPATQKLPEGGKLHDGIIYIGNDPANPAVGDLKISFQYIPDGTELSIVARQVKETFQPFVAANGSQVSLIQSGIHSADAMFSTAQSANSSLTWLLRAVGFLMMFAGLNMMLSPLSVFGDIVPFIGTVIGAGVTVIALLAALALSLITIAIAWLFFRPILSIILLAISATAIIAVVRKIKRNPTH